MVRQSGSAVHRSRLQSSNARNGARSFGRVRIRDARDRCPRNPAVGSRHQPSCRVVELVVTAYDSLQPETAVNLADPGEPRRPSRTLFKGAPRISRTSVPGFPSASTNATPLPPVSQSESCPKSVDGWSFDGHPAGPTAKRERKGPRRVVTVTNGVKNTVEAAFLGVFRRPGRGGERHAQGENAVFNKTKVLSRLRLTHNVRYS